MNDLTLKLLEKALLATPGDWETRSHLIEQYLAKGNAQRACEILNAAPSVPDSEEGGLLKARVEIETAPNDALATLQLLMACVLSQQGMHRAQKLCVRNSLRCS